MELDIKKIKDQAEKELKEEEFREAVDKMKESMKNKKSLWNKLFPYKLIILRKEEN